MYDGVRVVKALPVVVGCVAMRDRCKCYTDQGTDALLTGEQCRNWLASPPFNPWLDRAQQGQVVQAKQGTPEKQDAPLGVVIADAGQYGGVPPSGPLGKDR